MFSKCSESRSIKEILKHGSAHSSHSEQWIHHLLTQLLPPIQTCCKASALTITVAIIRPAKKAVAIHSQLETYLAKVQRTELKWYLVLMRPNCWLVNIQSFHLSHYHCVETWTLGIKEHPKYHLFRNQFLAWVSVFPHFSFFTFHQPFKTTSQIYQKKFTIIILHLVPECLNGPCKLYFACDYTNVRPAPLNKLASSQFFKQH